MSDDRDERRDPPRPDGARRAGDDTQEFDPFADDEADGPGTTTPLPSPAADDTAALPAADETAHLPAADETQQLPQDDRTAPLAGGAAWSGRAGVPPPDATAIRGPVPREWEPAPDSDDRRWWMPIVLGIIALLLIGLLVTGVWLIMRSNSDTTPAESTQSPSTVPTTAAPTTAAPTTSSPAPQTTAPVSVEVPPLAGLTLPEARQRLDALGLTYRLEFRESDDPPGTVIESDPAAGASVPEGTQIVLTIAEARPTTAPPITPTTAAADPSPTP